MKTKLEKTRPQDLAPHYFVRIDKSIVKSKKDFEVEIKGVMSFLGYKEYRIMAESDEFLTVLLSEKI